MSVQVMRRLFTVDEYYQMAEAGILSEDDRVELIKGEIVEMSPIGARHAAASVMVCRQPTPEGYKEVRQALPGNNLSPQAFPRLEVAVDALLGLDLQS